jgi:hypothetical protein
MTTQQFEDFTIFDVFIKYNELYVICSIDNDPVNESSICIELNTEQLIFNRKYIKDEHEPILVFVYNINNKIDQISNMVTFEYDNNLLKFHCLNIQEEERKTLTLTTLFQDDYKLFPLFYDYYKKQGVEHFYMYYNGIITDSIRNMFNINDVTLIEWNFRYWNSPKCKYRHHAQMGQMHHAIYKYGKEVCEYMVFCDLDEYLCIPKFTLQTHILKHPDIDVLGFRNKWSECNNVEFPDKCPFEFATCLEMLPYGNRSKNICKIDNLITTGIHRRQYFSKKQISTKYRLDANFTSYHFYNWSRPNRKIAGNAKQCEDNTSKSQDYLVIDQMCNIDINGYITELD